MWDGVFVMASWQMASGEAIGMSGGQIVRDILSEALDKVDCELYVQECSPGCRAGLTFDAVSRGLSRLLPP
jgi:hypothetical protein